MSVLLQDIYADRGDLSTVREQSLCWVMAVDKNDFLYSSLSQQSQRCC